MTSIAVKYIMQARLLATCGGSPILGEMWMLPPAAATSTSHYSMRWMQPLPPVAAKAASNTQPLRTAEGSEGS